MWQYFSWRPVVPSGNIIRKLNLKREKQNTAQERTRAISTGTITRREVVPETVVLLPRRDSKHLGYTLYKAADGAHNLRLYLV